MKKLSPSLLQTMVLLLAAILLLGCRNRNGEATPTPAPTAAGTATSVSALVILPTATPTRAVPLLSEVAIEPVGVSSYGTSLTFWFTSTTAVSPTINAQVTSRGRRVFDPPAAELTFNAVGVGPGAGSGTEQSALTFTLITVGDRAYNVFADGRCVAVPADSANPITALMDAGLLMERMTGVQQSGTTELNGRAVAVYSFDESALDPNDPSNQFITEIEGRLYVDLEENFVVRVTMQGRGLSGMIAPNTDSEGEIAYTLDFSDFNQPTTITPPPGCEE